jgi:hypothetical protein
VEPTTVRTIGSTVIHFLVVGDQASVQNIGYGRSLSNVGCLGSARYHCYYWALEECERRHTVG